MISNILIMSSIQFPLDAGVDHLVHRLREIRDAELKATDFWALSDRVMTTEQIAYRQALRDLPATATLALDDNGFLIMDDFPVYDE